MLKALILNAGGRAGEAEGYADESGFSDGVAQDFENMRQIGKMLLASGMLGNNFALNLENLSGDKTQLPEAVANIIDCLSARAIGVARDVIKVIGPKRFAAFAKDSLALEGELLGADARDFYMKRLNPEELKKMEGLILDFLRSPLGTNGAAKPGPEQNAPNVT